MDTVDSTTFIKRPPLMTEKENNMLYTKKILSGRLFNGHYIERRYVSVLKEYRDLIVISPAETELCHDIIKVLKKWINISSVKWIGMTGPDILGTPKAYCFWVKPFNLPFGHYWFQIKHVKLVEEEIILYLKCIRKALAYEYADTFSAIQQHETHRSNENSHPDTTANLPRELFNFNPGKTFFSLCEALTKTFYIIKPHITLINFVKVIKIICALTVVVVTGTVTLVQKFGGYFLKLIRELSILINALTPIIITLIDCFTKIVGGVFILMARILNKRGPNHGSDFNTSHYRSIPISNIMKNPDDWRKRNEILRQELLYK